MEHVFFETASRNDLDEISGDNPYNGTRTGTFQTGMAGL
jgi:hypothetical protein